MAKKLVVGARSPSTQGHAAATSKGKESKPSKNQHDRFDGTHKAKQGRQQALVDSSEEEDELSGLNGDVSGSLNGSDDEAAAHSVTDDDQTDGEVGEDDEDGEFEQEEEEQDTQGEDSQAAPEVLADVPELLSVLRDMRAALEEMRGRMAPLLQEVRDGGLPTSEGLSYLEAKHLLLLQYCMCIVVLLMLKAEGRSIKDHPVVGRLVQLRAFIERARPIDKQLAYQIDKLLRSGEKAGEPAAAEAGEAGDQQLQQEPGAPAAAGGADALRYRPNPSALVTKTPLRGGVGADGAGAEADAGEGGGGVYRPPKLNPVAMEDDLEVSRQERRRQQELKRRAKRSSLVKELAQELAGAPEEVEVLLPGMDSSAAKVTRARLDARAAQEEELMMRVPLSKKETKRLKAHQRAGLSGQGLLDDFEDEVADLVGMAAGGGGRGAARRRHREEMDMEGPESFGAGGGKRHSATNPDDDFFAASRAARASAKGKRQRR